MFCLFFLPRFSFRLCECPGFRSWSLSEGPGNVVWELEFSALVAGALQPQAPNKDRIRFNLALSGADLGLFLGWAV